MNQASKRLLILVADDHDHAARMMAQLLESVTPHDAIWAKDGAEAFRLTLERRPAVCVLDIDMPVVDGLSTARAIETSLRERRPLLIGLTVGAERTPEVESAFDHVLSKPVVLAELLGLLPTA